MTTTTDLEDLYRAPVTLNGKHVTLLPLTLEHGEALFRALNGDEELWRYIPVKQPETSCGAPSAARQPRRSALEQGVAPRRLARPPRLGEGRAAGGALWRGPGRPLAGDVSRRSVPRVRKAELIDPAGGWNEANAGTVEPSRFSYQRVRLRRLIRYASFSRGIDTTR